MFKKIKIWQWNNFRFWYSIIQISSICFSKFFLKSINIIRNLKWKIINIIFEQFVIFLSIDIICLISFQFEFVVIIMNNVDFSKYRTMIIKFWYNRCKYQSSFANELKKTIRHSWFWFSNWSSTFNASFNRLYKFDRNFFWWNKK